MRHRLRFIAAALILPAALSHAQQEPEPGQLLVASAALTDPNFSETVLLVVHHGQDGSLAVALNRPTWVVPEEAFPEVPDLNSYGEQLFFGGPMAPNQLLIVFETRDDNLTRNARPLLDDIYVTVDVNILDEMEPPAMPDAPRIRLFAGHASWNPGQLEAEIAAGNWRVLPAEPSQVFDASPGDLWQRLPLGIAGVTAALRPPRLLPR
jgi:putative transcriptional regulator